jgi:acyl-coenzyme A synthetase/AMP-(fatty) acid ligase
MQDEKINITKIVNIIKSNSDKKLIHLVKNDRKITYSDFLKKSKEFLNFLKYKKNLKRKDKIIIKLENSAEYLISIFACCLGGFVACPVDKETPITKYNKIKKILKAKYEINKFNKVKYIKDKDNKFQIKNKNSLCLILFTSGSTGEPKGIQIKLQQYFGSAFEFGKLAEYSKETNIYHCLPMHYNAGLLNTFFSGLLHGSTITIGPQVNMINLFYFWNNISKFKINSIHIVPEIANALLNINFDTKFKNSIKNVKKIISTGSYLYEQTKTNFQKKYKKRILSCYGLTEIGGPITLQNLKDTYKENSVGSLIKNVNIKIVKKNELNLVFIKTPYLFDSYLLENGKVQKPQKINGFFNTNDIGSFQNKKLFIYGRKKEIFKRGSEIVSTQNIENISRKFKNVIDCAAITEENISKGTKIYLLAQFKKNIAEDKNYNQFRKFLEKHLKKIEFPDKILIVSKIYRTPSGKIKKKDLQKIYL